MNILKGMLIFYGTLFLVLGVLGIFIPGLPTTPFLLLTAGLYLRSSDRLYQKVISNRYIGKYILDFQTQKGMSLKLKIFSISMMWVMILLSCVFFISNKLLLYLLPALGLAGTLVMGFLVKTISENTQD